jgi:subtilisin family serine protease/subtilisin-like proprotein convertase family protein
MFKCRSTIVLGLAVLLTGVGGLAIPIPPAGTTHFAFRETRSTGYHVEASPPRTAKVREPGSNWVRAWPDNGSTNYVEFGSRLVLELRNPNDLDRVLGTRPLSLARGMNDHLFILQAPDVWTALTQAQSLAQDSRVTASYPIARRRFQLLDAYAPRPNDPFFFRPNLAADQWQANLENRDTNAVPQGVDLNLRAAWAITRGAGITLALGDDGVELNHPDLVARTAGAPHFSFLNSDTNGMPAGTFSYHATAVAGLAAATANNQIGISGVAPEAQVASWVIFDSNDNLISEEALADMFQYQSNIVSVQNHSWGKVGTEQLQVSSLEEAALSNAVQFGRSGRGVVIVRAAGNGREDGNDVNEDGYLADPRVIAAAAVRLDGRVTRYSSPGACVLVAAPSGDVSPDTNPCFANSPNLVTTDRQGALGYNKDTSSFGGGDYTFGANGFSGTSGATPQITGIASLILAANPSLTYRDVQQILIQAGRHFDLTDPTLITNAAGFRVSHNLGFGVPDAGLAVRLAQHWSNRPAAVTVTYSATNTAPIPDLGLRLQLQADNLPTNLQSIVALPGGGPHPSSDTTLMPLVDVGSATNAITVDLTGRAALIQRGINYFCEKISFAAQAGAQLAIIYNNTGGDARLIMAGTDLTPIPSICISQNDGEALVAFLSSQPQVQGQLTLQPTNYTFTVTNTLQCEFVGVRLQTDHTGRGDLRIVLTSPTGTQSVLQRVNQDTLPGPVDWTYYSVQHFYESSFGAWTLSVLDEDTKGTGSVTSASLILTGVPITDTDHDGLDDQWELAHFGTLAYGPKDDPDHDGYINSREEIMGTDPQVPNDPLELNLSLWDARLARLSWPSSTNAFYKVNTGSDSVIPLVLATNLPGHFPQTEWFVPYTNSVPQFFQVEAVPNQ